MKLAGVPSLSSKTITVALHGSKLNVGRQTTNTTKRQAKEEEG
jgi:hypothetical protein